jgi:hypothetical protein
MTWEVQRPTPRRGISNARQRKAWDPTSLHRSNHSNTSNARAPLRRRAGSRRRAKELHFFWLCNFNNFRRLGPQKPQESGKNTLAHPPAHGGDMSRRGYFLSDLLQHIKKLAGHRRNAICPKSREGCKAAPFQTI